VIDPRTLRGQLGLAYAAALLVALIAFAAATLALVDRTQRSTLDDRLHTAALAVGAIVEQRDGRLALDTNDPTQFARIVGTRLNGALLDAGGRPVLSTVVAVPEPIRALVRFGLWPRTHTVVVGGENVRVAELPVPAGGPPLGAAVVWRDLDSVDELDRRLALVFALAIPAVAAFAIVGGSAVAARGLRPLVTMAQVASEIEASDLSRRLAIPPRDDELGRLVVTFDRMLDRLQEAFVRQRRFTSDASHELRAPLSVIRAEADLMLRKRRTPEEYERALRAIAAQADDLESLTRDLLAAARAESEAGARASVDLAAVADAAAERLATLARARNVTIRRDGTAEAIVQGDAAALRRAVICLVHNALKYARATVVISVLRQAQDDTVEAQDDTVEAQDDTVEAQDDTVELRVEDDGPGFSPEALEHATERFWRDDPARERRADGADDGGGTGLGLSIARAIVEAAGGSVRLENRASGGATVVVELPRDRTFMSL
jgi:signal transduction histidine kinase